MTAPEDAMTNTDERAAQALRALDEIVAGTCPQLQDEIARNVPPGLRQPCDHAPCTPYRDARRALAQAKQLAAHVPGRIKDLERQRDLSLQALRDFEPCAGDALVDEALDYLRSTDPSASVPHVLVEWGQRQSVDAAKTLRCPLRLGGHQWELKKVPPLPVVDELIRHAREAGPRVQQRFVTAIVEAERLVERA